MSGSIPTSNVSFSGIVNAYNNVNTTNLSTTNISLSSFRSKSFSDSTTVPSSGAISLNSHFKGKTWGAPSLYTFSSHIFTNCGVTGRYGPSLTQCKASYSPSWTDNTAYFNVVTQGIQIWTVPETGTYEIEVWGAQGGQGETSNNNPGKGQKIKYQFNLIQSDKLYIVVGQEGLTDPTKEIIGGGGGGGTFVILNNNDPLIIAGGGNGGSWYAWNTNGPDAQTTYDDRGTPGNGGRGGHDHYIYGRGGGGGGYIVNGINAEWGTYGPGYSYQNLAYGGSTWHCDSYGGFGGGGASWREGGGGGGYVGGDVVLTNAYNTNYPSYGAGSFIKNVASGSVSSLGLNANHGKVIITKL